MRVRGMLAEQRSLKGRVIAEDHRKTVEAQDVARLNLPICDRIMCSVGVDARLEPGPAIHQLDEGEFFANLADHCVCRGERHLIFGNASRDGVVNRLAAQVADPSAFLYEGDLLGRFSGPHPHCRLSYVDRLDARQRLLELASMVEADMIEFDAEPAHGFG